MDDTQFLFWGRSDIAFMEVAYSVGVIPDSFLNCREK